MLDPSPTLLCRISSKMTIVRGVRRSEAATRSRSRIIEAEVSDPEVARDVVYRAAREIRPRVEIDFVRSVRK
jgi:hypothetical protein